MHLDEFLNQQRIAKLQTLQWLWAPTTRRSSSKSELLRLLRRSMLSPERVRKRFDTLAEPQRDLLRRLLRLEGYEGNVAVMLRRVRPDSLATETDRESLDEVARLGFLTYAVVRDTARREIVHAVMPRELGAVLAEALNLDTREPGLMLSLGRTLAERPPDERLRLAGRHAPVDEQAEELAQPAAAEERIAALPNPEMRRAVRLALGRHAGILPLERLADVGLVPERFDRAEWRQALEDALVGTVGHLCLLEYGLGDDGQYLVVYQEIVQRWAPAQAVADLPVDPLHACGIDFVTDLGDIVDFVRASPCKLTSARRFFKGARNQLVPRAACRSPVFMDEEALLAFKLTVARELDLVEIRADGRLHASSAGRDWQALSLLEKARSVLHVLLELGETSVPQPHFQALATAAQQAVRTAQPGAWYPTQAFLGAILSDHLASILGRRTPPGEAPAPPHDPTWPPPHASDTLGRIAANAAEPLLRAFHYVGLIDVGQCADATFVRTTPLVPVFLGDAELPTPSPGHLLLVNPDFEVVLFPEDGHIELLHRLSAFCEREKSEVTLHLRITQESIQRAALRGIHPQTIIDTLRAHCRVPLSQNIEYSILSWANSVHPADIQTLHVLELPAPELLDTALHLPEIAPLVLRRLSPTAVALTVPELDQQAQDALAHLGIYLT